MVELMLLAGLRRCEVIGLGLADVRPGEQRVFRRAQGRQPANRARGSPFFLSLASYLDGERPTTALTDKVFVVLKGRRRVHPLSADGLDEILDGARGRWLGARDVS
jgi:integrase/recombinase XerD